MREHGEALEADFQHQYGIDLADLWRGRMTPRRAAVLALQLPAGSATWASCGFDAAWTNEAHLSATILDALRGANWQRGGGKGVKPTPLPRPGDEARKAMKLSRAAANAKRFAAKRAKRQRAVTDGG